MNRVIVLVAAAVAVALATTAYAATGSTSKGKLKAAWIYVGSPSDAGWTHAHDQGRLEVQRALGDKVQTIFKTNVPEGPQVSQVIDDLVRQGAKIIFSTSFGFQPAMVQGAKKYPSVYFEQATGTAQGKNLSEYFGAAEDGDYLTGLAAGAASKTGKLGFVAPFPIPEVIREINAFTLGARATHPGATVRVVWTNTWFDPAKERQAAQSLVTAGVDTMGDGQDSPTTGQVAGANGIKWTGYDSNQLSFAPNVWLTATTYHWGDYYLNEVKAAIDGTWKSQFYYGSIKDGFIRLAPFGKSVPAATRSLVLNKQKALESGSFYEFAGPLYDQQGTLRVKPGQRLTVKDLYAINWFVKGVIGSPKG